MQPSASAYGPGVMRSIPVVVAAVLTLSLPAAAEQPRKLKGTKSESAPKVSLDLPTFDAIPKDQKLETATKKDRQTGPSTPKIDEGYSVVRIVIGKAFIRTPEGAKPSAPYPAVALTSTNPNVTEAFSSIIRVKSGARRNARIEVAVLDQRADTVMEASGELRFNTGDEAEWQVDWDPTQIRNPGDFQFLVRVGGNPLGTFPLKISAGTAEPSK